MENIIVISCSVCGKRIWKFNALTEGTKYYCSENCLLFD